MTNLETIINNDPLLSKVNIDFSNTKPYDFLDNYNFKLVSDAYRNYDRVSETPLGDPLLPENGIDIDFDINFMFEPQWEILNDIFNQVMVPGDTYLDQQTGKIKQYWLLDKQLYKQQLSEVKRTLLQLGALLNSSTKNLKYDNNGSVIGVHVVYPPIVNLAKSTLIVEDQSVYNHYLSGQSKITYEQVNNLYTNKVNKQDPGWQFTTPMPNKQGKTIANPLFTDPFTQKFTADLGNIDRMTTSYAGIWYAGEGSWERLVDNVSAGALTQSLAGLIADADNINSINDVFDFERILNTILANEQDFMDACVTILEVIEIMLGLYPKDGDSASDYIAELKKKIWEKISTQIMKLLIENFDPDVILQKIIGRYGPIIDQYLDKIANGDPTGITRQLLTKYKINYSDMTRDIIKKTYVAISSAYSDDTEKAYQVSLMEATIGQQIAELDLLSFQQSIYNAWLEVIETILTTGPIGNIIKKFNLVVNSASVEEAICRVTYYISCTAWWAYKNQLFNSTSAMIELQMLGQATLDNIMKASGEAVNKSLDSLSSEFIDKQLKLGQDQNLINSLLSSVSGTSVDSETSKQFWNQNINSVLVNSWINNIGGLTIDQQQGSPLYGNGNLSNLFTVTSYQSLFGPTQKYNNNIPNSKSSSTPLYSYVDQINKNGLSNIDPETGLKTTGTIKNNKLPQIDNYFKDSIQGYSDVENQTILNQVIDQQPLVDYYNNLPVLKLQTNGYNSYNNYSNNISAFISSFDFVDLLFDGIDPLIEKYNTIKFKDYDQLQLFLTQGIEKITGNNKDIESLIKTDIITNQKIVDNINQKLNNSILPNQDNIMNNNKKIFDLTNPTESYYIINQHILFQGAKLAILKSYNKYNNM